MSKARWQLIARSGALLAAGALSAALAACGGGSATTAKSPSRARTPADLHGAVASPPQQAPPLALKDSLGHYVNLASYRGKAVLVTFIYTHCPDTCPLIISHLHTAQAELGPAARKLHIVAVSADPKGDTPHAVKTFLAKRQMTGRMEYLIGGRAQLQRVWKQWGVAASGKPGAVSHSALVYGISASGKVMVLYPANFKPSAIVRDVPKLASS